METIAMTPAINWTIRSIDGDLRPTLLPETFTGTVDEAFAFSRTLDPNGAERLELDSDILPKTDLPIIDPLITDSPTTFDLTLRPRKDGWTLRNDDLLAYPMWYEKWRHAIGYAAFRARGSEILVRVMDANSVCRKLVLIIPVTCSYTDGLRFPDNHYKETTNGERDGVIRNSPH